MPCLTTSGIERDCEFAQGGLTGRIWIANHSEVSLIEGADNVLTTITMAAVDNYFYLFEAEDNTANWAASLQKGSQTFYNHTLSFTSPRKSGNNNVIVEKLALGRFIAIVEDNNNQLWVLGMANPDGTAGVGQGLTAVTDGANAASGTVNTDSAGYIISLAGGVNGLPAEFSAVANIPVAPVS